MYNTPKAEVGCCKNLLDSARPGFVVFDSFVVSFMLKLSTKVEIADLEQKNTKQILGCISNQVFGQEIWTSGGTPWSAMTLWSQPMQVSLFAFYQILIHNFNFQN